MANMHNYRPGMAAESRHAAVTGIMPADLAAELDIPAAELSDLDVGKIYMSNLPAAARCRELERERYVRIKSSAESITPQYGNPLGVRVQSSLNHDSDKLIEVAAARERAELALDELSSIVRDVRSTMAAACLSSAETVVIEGRYFTDRPRPYRRFVEAGIVGSHNTARAAEKTALEKIGHVLRTEVHECVTEVNDSDS